MGAFLDLLKQKPRALWLDSHAYAARLLAGGQAPWLNVAECIGWQRKAQGLLRSDVAILPLAAVVAAWLDAQADLRIAMAGKSRAVYPLKTLLADEALRTHLVELVRGLRAGFTGLPLVLVLPSPRAWVALSYQQAHNRTVEVGEDEADSGSVYMADFLRSFGELGLDALLLQEEAGFSPASAQDLACYQSVFNVAAHYRWDLGLHLPSTQDYSGELPAGCGFAVAARLLNGTPTAVLFNWASAAPPVAGAFRYAEIPPDAQPEAVLERLAALR